MRETSPRGGRRAPAPPPELSAELVRPRLLGVLGKRFDVPLTVIVAGAGFGKSTLLAQAMRANDSDPRGVDAWFSCQPGDGDAERVAAAVVTALLREPPAAHGSPDRREPVERVLDAFAHLAPIDVCLVVDDVHEIPAGSSAAQLLTGVVRRLPPHAHAVFAGRSTPPVALARRRAAGQLADIGPAELAFTPEEVGALAGLLGRDPGTLAVDLGGWPSLVRLALSAPEGAAPQFLWQEVVAGLPDDERLALLALATLSWGTAGDVSIVAGERLGADPDVALDALVDEVPLTHRDVDGVYGVHQLWEEAVERIFPAAECDAARRRALGLFDRRGDTLRAGWSALRWGYPATLGSAARHLVRDTIGALPIDTAERWLSSADAEARAMPELGLLDIALSHARHYDDLGLDGQLDDLVARFVAIGDDVSAAVTLALAAVIAHTRGDAIRLLAIDERARSLHRASEEPILRFLAGAMVAGKASLAGDAEGAIEAIEALSFDDVPDVVAELMVRTHVNMLCYVGRAEEAVAVSTRLLDSPSAYVRSIAAHVRWCAGDPSAFRGGRLDVAVAPGTNERYHFYHASYMTAVAASFGDATAIGELRPVIERFAAGTLDSRDRSMIAVARALHHVAVHDDSTAARVIAAHVDEHPADDRLADVHLRRLLAVAYVSDERVRRRWRDAALGPSLRRQRAVADDLLAARAQTLTADAELTAPEAVLTTLPLPWSVELAARAVALGCRSGEALARGLVELAHSAVTAELDHACAAADAVLRDGARTLRAALPDAASPPVRIGVLGPLTVVAGEDEGQVELRRGRVRTVIALLAVLGPLRRERIADLLWPEHDAVAAARNLRVTLSRVRSALTPPESSSRALDIDHDVVGFAASDVEVDLWQFRDEVAAAAEAEHVGDAAASIAALERACALWRGAPLDDVEPVPELAGPAEEVRRLVADAALRLGELLLVAGDFDAAGRWAERVAGELPYSERAHRLRIAACLQRHDRSAIGAAVAEARSMLDEIGVEPEPATRMLLRQADARLAPVLVDGTT